MPEPADGSAGAFLVAWKQEGEEKRECSAAVRDCAACIEAHQLEE